MMIVFLSCFRVFALLVLAARHVCVYMRRWLGLIFLLHLQEYKNSFRFDKDLLFLAMLLLLLPTRIGSTFGEERNSISFISWQPQTHAHEYETWSSRRCNLASRDLSAEISESKHTIEWISKLDRISTSNLGEMGMFLLNEHWSNENKSHIRYYLIAARDDVDDARAQTSLIIHSLLSLSSLHFMSNMCSHRSALPIKNAFVFALLGKQSRHFAP